MLRSWIDSLTEIIYPRTCLSCKKKIGGVKKDAFVCPACWEKAERNLPPFCRSCGRQLKKQGLSKNICPSCSRSAFYFDRAFSPYVYSSTVKDLIHEFKYKGKDHLGQGLGDLMADFIREYNLPLDCIDMIIPIPLHKSRLREREFNQAELLAKTVGARFKKDLLNKGLERIRPTRTQTELPAHERALNVRESFRVSDPSAVRDKNVLLIDDVFTSGATSSEAAKALKDAGAKIVFVLTLAN
ncbi:MAG: ComF family protein [Candidatus Omnitrophica bacterium]|nr:ComF family protein [Candidatus Omnitrophota bacterium]